jgi:hypothetical protein
VPRVACCQQHDLEPGSKLSGASDPLHIGTETFTEVALKLNTLPESRFVTSEHPNDHLHRMQTSTQHRAVQLVRERPHQPENQAN